MSLVILACDSAQALAVSEGRAFVMAPHKRFLTDDLSKVLPIGPRLMMAMTGQGITLALAVRDFAHSWRERDGNSFFQDVAAFVKSWTDNHPLRDAIAVVLFGWDDGLGRMRVSALQGGRLIEVSPPGEHLPIHIAMGRTENIGVLPPETFVQEPFEKMREIVRAMHFQIPDVGPRIFEYLIQAPEEVLCRTDAGRVWPRMNAQYFNFRLKAYPPAEIETVLAKAQELVTAGARR